MARERFGWGGFLIRWFFALALVLCTYNPHGYSYYDWAIAALPDVSPEKAVAGLLLLIGWIVYLRATLRSLGPIGIGLALALLGSIVWLLVSWGWLAASSPKVVVWIILIVLSLILAIGMSWSFVRRRLAGQVDVDDVEE